MRTNTKRTVLGIFVTATAAAALTGLMSTSAAAVDLVPCTSDEFSKFDIHGVSIDNELHKFSTTICLAQAGEMSTWGINYQLNIEQVYADHIWTGNNRVQYLADGRWQPDQPIDKWTNYSWPHYPGGVRVDAFRIV